MKIGDKIRTIRELRGYSQSYTADMLDMSQRQFSRIENDQAEVTLSKLGEIVSVLEVSVSELLGFDEKNIFQNCANAVGSQQTYNAFPKELKEQYESRIVHLEEEVVFLRKHLDNKV